MRLSQVNKQVDLSDLIDDLKKKYKNLYLFQFGDQVFVYRSIGRKEYRDLVLNENLTDQEKEEIECSTCVLWPQDFDFANCEEAGLPTQLAQAIEENSYISEENRTKVLNYHRSEMFDLDNQINCIICAAFPNLSLEEVEEWDVATASKYLSRSEWILTNLRGIPFREKAQQSGYVSRKTFGTEEIKTEEDNNDTIKSTASNSDVDHTGKPKMTPQKLAELKAKYPTIDWDNDMGNLGIEGIQAQNDVDVTPVALRPMSQVRKLKKKPPAAPPKK